MFGYLQRSATPQSWDQLLAETEWGASWLPSCRTVTCTGQEETFHQTSENSRFEAVPLMEQLAGTSPSPETHQ